MPIVTSLFLFSDLKDVGLGLKKRDVVEETKTEFTSCNMKRLYATFKFFMYQRGIYDRS